MGKKPKVVGHAGEKQKPDDPEQSRRFIDAAKLLGVDESGNMFESAAKKMLRRRSQKNA